MARIFMKAKNSVIKNVRINIDSGRSYAKTETSYNPAHIVYYEKGVYGPTLKTVDPNTGESLNLSSGVYGETVMRQNPKTGAYSKEVPGVYGVRTVIYDPVTGIETTHSPGVYGTKVSHRKISDPKSSLATKAPSPRGAAVTTVMAHPTAKHAPITPPVDNQATQADYPAVPNLAESMILAKLQGKRSEHFDEALMLKRLRNGEFQLSERACKDRLVWAEEHLDWLILGLHDDEFWRPLQGQPFEQWSKLLALSERDSPREDPHRRIKTLPMPVRVLGRHVRQPFWADRVFAAVFMVGCAALYVSFIGTRKPGALYLALIAATLLLTSGLILDYKTGVPWLEPLRRMIQGYKQEADKILLEDSLREDSENETTLNFSGYLEEGGAQEEKSAPQERHKQLRG